MLDEIKGDRLALGLTEMARRIGVSVCFLRLKIRRGRLWPVRLGRRVVITVGELQRYLEAGARAQATPQNGVAIVLGGRPKGSGRVADDERAR
jgi:excisionase family DNA binding protein